MGKGADFERVICKSLSLWWTDGKRDDVFWRTSQSGGRATQRAKHQQKTFGSYGDVAAVDPIGLPLLKCFAIELKRGYSNTNPAELLEAAPTKAVRPWEAAVCQAQTAMRQSGALGWLLIVRRDRKSAVAYVPISALRDIGGREVFAPPCIRYRLRVNGDPLVQAVDVVALRLEDFMARVGPAKIIKAVKTANL